MVTTIKPQRAVIRSLMAVLMAALAIGLVSPSAKADTALPAGTAIAVAGANSQVYVRGPGQLGFTNWGGLVVGSPAVVMVQNITHVLALGTNNYVYHKSDRTGWHRLTTLPYYCTHISATFDGTTIVGACRGGQGALYTFDFDALEDVPVVTEMTKLGGLFQGTPAVIVTDAGPTFFVVGGAYVSNNWIYNVHEWTEDEGWVPYYTYCQGPPAASSTVYNYFFACQRQPGEVLVESWQPGGEDGVWNVYTFAGATIGTIGLAPTGTGLTAQLYVAGSNTAVYTKMVDHAGSTIATPWTALGGLTLYGVSASTTLNL
jgi:hypothetical protein